PDDSTILIFENLEKGLDISDSSWVLDYNVFKGPIDSNGASKDEIYVLLYNVIQNGGLLPGNYFELFKVNYKIVDLPNTEDSIKSSMQISNAEASTSFGDPIVITPSRDEFTIYAKVPVVIPDYGLIFERDTIYQLEDDSYTELMQLIGLPAKAQALQFRLLFNTLPDDNTILTFQSIQKSDDISDPSWVLTYNVFRGPLTSNGASVDEVLVLLYNLNYNNGLPPGDYYKLLEVKYRIADLPALEDSVKSSIKISNAEASTYQGFPINITPSRDQLTIIARNRIGYYGDVNGDGCLDVLDIIMIVDHIIGRDSLDEEQFGRADLAPWVHGSPRPYPDGVVNVQDLSLLQNIILSGFYPDGTPINGCSYTTLPKQNGENDVKVTLYIYPQGITAYLKSNVGIRGAQIEFANVGDNPDGMFINTDLGHGYYQYVAKNLRTLLYDRQGQKIIPSGEHMLGDIPFQITRPQDITLERIFLVDEFRQPVTLNEVEIIYGTPPSIPLDYILYQNFPNPFNPTTTIRFTIPDRSTITLKVYDVLGNEISTLVNEDKNRGIYNVTFNGTNLASGVYFYQLRAVNPSTKSDQSFIQTKKMMFVK
ncbi:MAG: T9SS type A sorting domain-containing protein, partial [Ignavibacteriales bacterium]